MKTIVSQSEKRVDHYCAQSARHPDSIHCRHKTAGIYKPFVLNRCSWDVNWPHPFHCFRPEGTEASEAPEVVAWNAEVCSFSSTNADCMEFIVFDINSRLEIINYKVFIVCFFFFLKFSCLIERWVDALRLMPRLELFAMNLNRFRKFSHFGSEKAQK